MAIDLKEYQQLKDDIDRLNRRADKGEGRKEHLLNDLLKLLGTDDLSEARDALDLMENELARKQRDRDKALRRLRREYGDLLGGE